jgi:hypothetical protein
MNFNLNKINLDLHRELNRAGEIISRDHFVRLESGKDVNGSRMTPLKDATIDRKGFNQILVDTDQMRHLIIDRATKTNQVVEVHPGRIRKYKGTNVTMADVGGYHQKGNKNLPKREWFGISENAEKRIVQFMRDKIRREVDSA